MSKSIIDLLNDAPDQTNLTMIPLDGLHHHPDNPRLQLRGDVVDQLAAEIGRAGFGREHALLVRPIAGGHQILSGHHRHAAAAKAGLAEVPCWVRDIPDDEAFMQLVLSNTQGELTPLEFGFHALRSVTLAQGKEGGGLSQYADRVGWDKSYVTQLRKAAEVASLVESTQQVLLGSKSQALYEISKAKRTVWPTLVSALIKAGWSVADTKHWVGQVREFDIPADWQFWLNPVDVVKRFLDTKEFAPSTVQRLIGAAEQVLGFIDGAVETEPTEDEFYAWLADGKNGPVVDPRAIAKYLARLTADEAAAKAARIKAEVELLAEAERTAAEAEALRIAEQFTVPDWHQGNWRDHIDTILDGSVALLLTDPPYGQGFQSDYRLDRRVDLKHETIAADADPITAMEELRAALDAMHPKLKDNAHILVFCGWAGEPEFRDVIEKAGYTLRGSLIWDKMATGMGDPTTTFAPAHERILHAVKGSPTLYARPADLLHYPRCGSERHPTEKPVELLSVLIEACTADGEIVADPFAGVASTLIAARDTSRRYWGAELDEKYWRAGETRFV